MKAIAQFAFFAALCTCVACGMKADKIATFQCGSPMQLDQLAWHTQIWLPPWQDSLGRPDTDMLMLGVSGLPEELGSSDAMLRSLDSVLADKGTSDHGKVGVAALAFFGVVDADGGRILSSSARRTGIRR